MPRPAKAPRKVAGRTFDEWIAQARAELAAGKRGRPFLAALYAAAAGKQEGAEAGDCPFDRLGEPELAAEWDAYFRIAAAAVCREAPATGARSQFQAKPRRTNTVRTGSAAYADLMGGGE